MTQPSDKFKLSHIPIENDHYSTYYMNTPDYAMRLASIFIEAGYRVQIGPMDCFTQGVRVIVFDLDKYEATKEEAKEGSLTCQQREQLLALQEIFGAEKLYRDCLGVYIGPYVTRLPIDTCLTDLFTFPGKEINIVEILERRKF